VAAGLVLAAGAMAGASLKAQTPQRDPLVEARELKAWIERAQDAAMTKNFSGTFVLMSPAGMTTSRITHFCDGPNVFEQLEMLDGVQRTQFRHNDLVHTVLPDRKLALMEKRETLNSFPQIIKSEKARPAEHYEFRVLGDERVAGHMSRAVFLKPKDNLRFGHRIWTEEKFGLVLKSQLLGPAGEVLEQIAFSEVNLGIAPQPERIKAAMRRVEGLRVEQVMASKVDAKAEGWQFRQSVPGFKEIACYKRQMRGDARDVNGVSRSVLQWVFSDGLANVSVFVEPYVRDLHVKEGVMAMGATHSLTQRRGDWWITVLGEVPAHALMAFAQSLERLDRGSK
jgi:sigma-E factor negative regulatory protein RseB